MQGPGLHGLLAALAGGIQNIAECAVPGIPQAVQTQIWVERAPQGNHIRPTTSAHSPGQCAEKVAELAVRHRLPTISDGGGFAEQGGLLYYGPDVRAMYPRVAVYVDRILRGAKPGELPIEQPSKFEFVINLKTARAIGAEPPRGLLLKVDRLVE